MKHFVSCIVCLMCAASVVTFAGNPKKKKTAPAAISSEAKPVAAPETITFSDFRDSLSYCLGVNIIGTMKQQSLDLNPIFLMRALEDAFSGQKPALSETDMIDVFKKFENDRQSKASSQSNPSSSSSNSSMEENKAKGKAFLDANGKKPGVTTTASGLQYRVITQGTGNKPTAADKVKVHYKGTLIDGSEFDSSYKRGQPIEFPLSGVIKGWTEGVQLMSVGSKFEFAIPAELAYGDREVGGVIPAGSTLIFEVELLDIPSQAK